MVGFLAPLFAAAIAKPAITAAVIGAGASLIGGKMNRDAQKKANDENRPGAQRAQYEAAGINPLFGMSSGSYVPVQAASMGDAFATAGGHFARMFDLEHEKQLQETATRKENERLREALDKLSRPSVPTLMEREGGSLPIHSAPGGNTTVPIPPGGPLRVYPEGDREGSPTLRPVVPYGATSGGGGRGGGFAATEGPKDGAGWQTPFVNTRDGLGVPLTFTVFDSAGKERIIVNQELMESDSPSGQMEYYMNNPHIAARDGFAVGGLVAAVKIAPSVVRSVPAFVGAGAKAIGGAWGGRDTRHVIRDTINNPFLY